MCQQVHLRVVASNNARIAPAMDIKLIQRFLRPYLYCRRRPYEMINNSSRIISFNWKYRLGELGVRPKRNRGRRCTPNATSATNVEHDTCVAVQEAPELINTLSISYNLYLEEKKHTRHHTYFSLFCCATVLSSPSFPFGVALTMLCCAFLQPNERKGVRKARKVTGK